ncbi:hypothetical protein ACFLTP_09845 [Chloroflexota bacterium]
MDKLIGWLLEGPPWVQYRTRLELLGQPEDNKGVSIARQAMLKHPQIKALLTELSGWPGKPLMRHNDASHLIHKLVFIADSGVKSSDPGVLKIVKRILDCRSNDGVFQVLANISPSHGGTGKDQLVWMLCDTPSILYAMIKMGMQEDPVVQSAAQHLAGISFTDGWACTVSSEMGKFRGPGRKTDPCPYGTLVALKALAQLPKWRDSSACLAGVNALLQLWEQRKERRPYLFAMGTDFAKLKAPFIWYDILHVLEVLTQFPSLRKDKRLPQMVDIVKAKSDAQGRFTAESAWKAWSDWGFGQKKTPSSLITLQVYSILKRISQV